MKVEECRSGFQPLYFARSQIARSQISFGNAIFRKAPLCNTSDHGKTYGNVKGMHLAKQSFAGDRVPK